MSNISDYLLHEDRLGNAKQLAGACQSYNGPFVEANRYTPEEIEKMRAEGEAREKEYIRRRRASLVLELAEKILLSSVDLVTKDAIHHAQEFFNAAETLMNTFELDKRA